MAKEIAIGKRAKISEAQQHMLLAVFGTSVLLGIAISLGSHFYQQISFNTKVIAATESSIAMYSDVIKSTGVCKKPNGSVYSDEELSKCNPYGVELSEIEGTLRFNILENLAANQALNSVSKKDNNDCKDAEGKTYTYEDLNQMYKDARGPEQLQEASNRIRSCSALRIIPDALPAFRNEEALLASLNKLFNISNWEPESIAPGGTADISGIGQNLNAIAVNFTVDADTGTVKRVLDSIERSIREFDINRINIEWANDDVLTLQTHAQAYYMNESSITESAKTITKESK